VPKPARQFAAEPFKNNNLNRFYTRKSSVSLGQTPLSAPVYAPHDTGVADTVNRGVFQRLARDVPLELIDGLALLLDDGLD
jgi:hypothetical protein